MKVSDLPTNNVRILIETKTDALREIGSVKSAAAYIEEFGDVEVVYDNYYRWYRVPAFAQERETYKKFKTRDCAIWGCE